MGLSAPGRVISAHPSPEAPPTTCWYTLATPPASLPLFSADHPGPDLGCISSPVADVEQPPGGTPGSAHFFHEPARLPFLSPATGYVREVGQLEVTSALSRFVPCFICRHSLKLQHLFWFFGVPQLRSLPKGLYLLPPNACVSSLQAPALRAVSAP